MREFESSTLDAFEPSRIFSSDLRAWVKYDFSRKERFRAITNKMGDENVALDVDVAETPSRAAKRKLQDEQKTQAKRLREEAFEKRKKEKEEQQRIKDEKKRDEDLKKAEEKRQKEEKKAEEKRLREEKKREEDLRKAEEKRMKEEKKREEEQRRAEEKRQKEEKKREEEERKLEEKRQKEIEKLQKKKEDEEKQEAKRLEDERKREEKRRAEEALEAKKKKEKDRFLSFFEKKDPPVVREYVPVDCDSPWKPFELKKGWAVAPILRRDPLTEEEYQNLMNITVEESTYIRNLTKFSCPKRDPMRPKLLQFHDNFRPPYYGTWRKKVAKITGKRFLAKEEIFDYNVDSDEEWVEDEEGEECMSDDNDLDSDDEKDEDDEKFLVAHGYLSEGEGDDETARETKEQRDARQRRKNDEWREEHEAKTVRNKSKVLIAKLYGPIFSFHDIPVEAKAMKMAGIVLNYAEPREKSAEA
ncbi:hypothetical protein QR680_009576 [Steinernema hermaphroditum]|uniref:Chromatin assembly factor 1 subunit A dimerization domain-containing protein n=1 Tax=Steinernema hermaphroditum TaxID=289476 RepID=A0AA39MA74_9BILA|nr:hypothetical protein QR680_009576 [Steinernema hermaphroditum]